MTCPLLILASCNCLHPQLHFKKELSLHFSCVWQTGWLDEPCDQPVHLNKGVTQCQRFPQLPNEFWQTQAWPRGFYHRNRKCAFKGVTEALSVLFQTSGRTWSMHIGDYSLLCIHRWNVTKARDSVRFLPCVVSFAIYTGPSPLWLSWIFWPYPYT